MKLKKALIQTSLVTSIIGLVYMVWYVYVEPKKELRENQGNGLDMTEPVKELSVDQSKAPTKKRADHRIFQPSVKQPDPTPRSSEGSTVNKSTRSIGINHEDQQVTKAPIADEFPLRLGSKGKRVERLQVWLLRNFGWHGTISGEFDQKTRTLTRRHLKTSQVDKSTYHRKKMGMPVYKQAIER